MESAETEFTISEPDIIRLMLEFLENRNLTASSDAIKRETSITNTEEDKSENDRLVQLLVKGLIYESCIDYCQAAATSSMDLLDHRPSSSLLTKSTLSHVDVSLLSWLYALPADTFSFSFAQRLLRVNLDRLSASPPNNFEIQPDDNFKNSNVIEKTKTELSHVLPVQRYRKIGHLEDIQAIRSVAVHPSGTHISIGSNSRILRVCRWPDSKPNVTPLKVIGQVPRHHIGSIYCLAWHPNGRVIASGSNDKLVKLIRFDSDCDSSNTSPLGPTAELNIHQGTIRDVCFLSSDCAGDSAALLSAGAGDCHIEVSDVSTQQSIALMLGHTMPVFSLTSLSASEFISAGQDGTWRLWDVRQRPTLVHCTNVDSTLIASIHSGNQGGHVGTHNYLATGHADGSVRLWDLRYLQTAKDTTCMARSSETHFNEIRSVRIKPKCSDCSLVVLSASYDNNLALTNFYSSVKPSNYVWQGSNIVGKHLDKAVTARWHPYLDAFVSSSADRSCVVWNAVSGPGDND